MTKIWLINNQNTRIGNYLKKYRESDIGIWSVNRVLTGIEHRKHFS